MNKEHLIIVRGGGDLATGTILKLWNSGFPVLVLETEHPAAIRRQVALCEAMYEGEMTVEGVRCIKISDPSEMERVFKQNAIPILADPNGESIRLLNPEVVVDAILAKRNLGTSKDMAPLTIALGPGFTAGEDTDLVIETKRGHQLGRIIQKGAAIANTGIPGNIGGFTKERVIHAECAGKLREICKIGDLVQKEAAIAVIKTPEGDIPVITSISGIVRGLIRDGYEVTKGFKIADIDPRESELQNCFSVSDKARCIAGGVLEAVCSHFSEKSGRNL